MLLFYRKIFKTCSFGAILHGKPISMNIFDVASGPCQHSSQ